MAEPNRKLSEVIWKSSKATLQVVIAEMKEFDPNRTPFWPARCPEQPTRAEARRMEFLTKMTVLKNE